jgi:hypothetical protein
MIKFAKFFRGDDISDERYAELMLMGQDSHDNWIRSIDRRLHKLERQYLDREIREIEELTNG